MHEAQSCLNTAPGHGGFTASQVALGPNPADLLLRHDDGSILEFTKEPSTPGQFAQQSKLRTTAYDAAPAIANSELGRPPSRNQSFGCPDVSVRDSAVLRVGGPEERAEVAGPDSRLGH